MRGAGPAMPRPQVGPSHSPLMFGGGSVVSQGFGALPAPDLQHHFQHSPKLLLLAQITLVGDSIFPSGGGESVGGRGCHNRAS